MKYILFVTNGSSSNARRLFHRIQQQHRFIETLWTSVSTCSADDRVETGKEDRETVWQPISEDHLDAFFKESTADTSVDGDSPLIRASQRIHEAADSLPAAAAVLDLFLWPPPYEDTSDYIQFVGALRRLKDWHNARTHIIEDCPTETTEFLSKFLAATVYLQVDDIDLIENTQAVWRGKISVADKLENKGLTIPGLQLSKLHNNCNDLLYPLPTHIPATRGRRRQHKLAESGHCRLGRMFEVLDEMSLSSVPSFIQTTQIFQLRSLYQKHVHSQVFFGLIQEKCQTGLLIRIPVYPSNCEPVPCKNTNLSTEAWKDNITADIQYSQEPDEEYQEKYEFLYFLVTPASKVFPARNFEVHAHLLHSPYHLNGNIAHTLYQQALLPHPPEDSVVMVNLNDLGMLNTDMLRQMNQDIVSLQNDFLQSWRDARRSQGQSMVVPESEVIGHLLEIQQTYLHKLTQALPRFNSTDSEHQQVILRQVTAEVTESNSSSEWPERLIQQYRESQRRCLTRIQSTESMPLSSPLQSADTTSSAMLDINDFLKFFKPDGSASASSDSSPVRRRTASGRGNNKLVQRNSQDNTHLTWPECKDITSHDVYYNCDKKCEKLNTRMNKIRDRYVKEDTFSSFSSAVITFPRHKKKSSCSPDNFIPRRSPRKRTHREMLDDNVNTSQTDPDRKRNKATSSSEALHPQKTIVRRKVLESNRRLSTPNILPSQKTRSRQDGRGRQQGTELADSRLCTSNAEKLDKRRESLGDTSLNSSLNSLLNTSGGAAKKESRSERHTRRLMEIVDNVLLNYGVQKNNPIFAACSNKLFKVTKLFVMDLPTSRNLKEEMKKIAEGQVKQVVDLETERQTISVQEKSKKKPV